MDLPAEDIERHESSLETEGPRKRFVANVGSNAAYIFAQTIAKMWLKSFLIGHLGIAAFGMIPLVNSLVSYMSILMTALNTAVSRFLAIELVQKDILAANRTFNTALAGLMGIIILLTPALLTVSFAFANLFEVPPGWERDASYLYAIVGIAFFATVVGSNFAISPFVHSRFMMMNVVSLAGLLTRVGFIVTLFSSGRAGRCGHGGTDRKGKHAGVHGRRCDAEGKAHWWPACARI